MAAFRSRHPRGGRWWAIGTTALVAVVFVVFFVASSGAIVTGSPSNFESADPVVPATNPATFDANMTVDTSGHSDWNCFAGHDGFHSPASDITVGQACSSALDVSAGFTSTDPAATTADDSWVNGTKMDQACEPVGTNKNPGKDDFINIASYSETLANTKNTYLYGATIRYTANGSASENVELNQNPGTASCPILRTAGDHLLAFDYNSGGKVLDLHVLIWIDSTDPTGGGTQTTPGTCTVKNDSMPCWGATALQPSPASFEGDTNATAIPKAKNAISYTDLVVGQFAEFGVNLTTALQQNPDACNTTNQIDWESRSSGSSFGSNPEDLQIEHHTISNCGEIIIHKQTSPRGIDKAFPFDSNIPNSTGTVTTSSSPYCQGDTTPNGTPGFSLNDNGGSGTTNTTGNTEDCKNVLQGSYTVTEETQSGFTLSGITCTTPTGGTSTVTYGSGNHGSFTAGDTSANISLKQGETVECTYTNHQNTSSLSTQASKTGSVTPGTGVSDLATVTGDSVNGNSPTGSVTFYLCGPLTSASGCDNTGTKLTPDSSLTTVAGITETATSPTVNSTTALSPGIYCFAAYWPGDTNYPAANSTTATNECFTVAKVNSSTATTPSTTSIALSAINGGSSVTDTAVVSPNPTDVGQITGTVNFFICGPIATGTCDGTTNVGTAVSGNPKTLGTASPPCPTLGTHAACAVSGAVGSSVITSVGRYCFRAEYSGDTRYNSSTDSANTECFTVTDSSTVTTNQSWRPQDSAEIKSAGGTALTGTVTFTLYDNGTCTAGIGGVHAIYTTGALDITTNGTGAANDRTLSTDQSSVTVTSANNTGAYSWQVVYSGGGATGNTSSCESTTIAINDNH